MKTALLVRLSLLAALIWQYWPMDPLWRLWLPDLLLMVCLYWLLRTPHFIGSWTLLGLGLLRDILDQGNMLGPHLLAISLTAYAALLLRPNFVRWNLGRQWLSACGLMLCYLLCCHWAQLLDASYANKPLLSQQWLTGVLLWPLFYPLMRWGEEATSPIRSAS